MSPVRQPSGGGIRRWFGIGAATLLMAGCAAISDNPGVTDSSGHAVSTLIPNKTIHLSQSVKLSVEALALGAAAYVLADPLAPNWQIEQAAIGPDKFRISLRKRRFSGGGDGEATQLFHRRAEQIARDGGYAGYTVLEYSESVESTLPVAQRLSQGVVQLKRPAVSGN